MRRCGSTPSPGKTTSVTLELAPISAYHFAPDGAGSFAEVVVHRRLEGAARPGARPMRLVVGARNHPSRSMRPWVLLTEFGLPFEEVAAGGDADTVPVLVDADGLVVRDMPAIAEFLAEKFPALALWPRDARQRTRARSLCAELQAGVGALDRHDALDVAPARGTRLPAEQAGRRGGHERVLALCQDALAASGGPFLFGGYSIADACCAPDVMRLRTGAPPQPADVAAYAERLVATRGVAAWIRAALAQQAARPFDARA